MTKIKVSPYMEMDIEDINAPTPPSWWVMARTSPKEFNISTEQEVLVRRYCYIIAMDDSSQVRTIFHEAVCTILDIEHGEFMPFEDESITKIPTPDEAVEIFWNAFKKYKKQI